MKQRMFRVPILAASILLPVSCVKQTTHTDLVVDEINLLSPDEIESFIREINDLQDAVGSEISVVVISTTGMNTIEEYSLELSERMEIGRPEINDGILLLLAIDDREVRIEIGYGLERIIGDEIAGSIIRDDIVPAFQQENYYEGILAAVIRLSEIIQTNCEDIGNIEGIGSANKYDLPKNKEQAHHTRRIRVLADSPKLPDPNHRQESPLSLPSEI